MSGSKSAAGRFALRAVLVSLPPSNVGKRIRYPRGEDPNDLQHSHYYSHATSRVSARFCVVHLHASSNIENETFSILKNQGDHFERKVGRGTEDLSMGLMHLMMLTLLIDQIQWRRCRLSQASLKAAKRMTRLWLNMRSRSDQCLIPDWETLYRSIITPPQLELGRNTSCLPP